MKLNKKSKVILIIIFVIIFFIIFRNVSFGATPKIIKTLTNAFEDIEDWILTLATPAAAVAVGVGLFMKKFSFGDEEKMRTAKKVIRGSLFSYAFVLAIDLILSAIESLVG